MNTLVVVILVFLSLSSALRDDLVIQTNRGKVRGVELKSSTGKNVNAWYGIPYAEIPVGDLRFKPPLPKKVWNGVLETTALPNACFQEMDTIFGDFLGETMWKPNTPISEDCLYINVVAPNPRPQNASVMVWIHAGGFYSGSSTLDIYDYKTLASEGNVIVVSMQYRVSSLGFLYFGNSEAPGNVGLLDQILALQWVRDNIAGFSGNPDEVTIFGVSAGSISVSYHLLSPLSRHLFTRGIMQSGTAASSTFTLNQETAIERGLWLAKELTCPHDANNLTETVHCLRKIDAKRIVHAERKIPIRSIFLPVKDGDVIVDPLQKLAQKDFKQTEILLGSNLNEGNFFLLHTFPHIFKNEENVTITYEDFVEVMRKFGHNKTESEVQAIFYEYTNWIDPNDSDAIMDALDKRAGDQYFTCPINEVARAYAEADNDVYVYYYQHKSDKHYWPKWAGSTHTDVLPFIFGTPLNPETGYSSDQIDLSRRMIKYWTNFAKTGNPNTPSEVPECNWPSYKNKNKFAYLNLDQNHCSFSIGGLRPKQCAFWDKFIPTLRECQMVYMETWEMLMYLGTPVMPDLNSLISSGLFINDLSMHDFSRDLMLAGTQQSVELKLALDQEQQKTKKLEDSMRKLDDEMKRTDELLYQMIPKQVADRLRTGLSPIDTCEMFDTVSILFSDVVTFTQICSRITPMQVVSMLNAMYSAFDTLTERNSVYKGFAIRSLDYHWDVSVCPDQVETIGDAYMVVGGAPEKDVNHAARICDMGLDMVDAIRDLKDPSTGQHLRIRVGVHSGAVVAGIVGLKMPRYCLFGDTVNTASRMESSSEPMKVQISHTTRDLIPKEYEVTERGEVEVKGKGYMKTYWLLSRTGRQHVSNLINISEFEIKAEESGRHQVEEQRKASVYSPITFQAVARKSITNSPVKEPTQETAPRISSPVPIKTHDQSVQTNATPSKVFGSSVNDIGKYEVEPETTPTNYEVEPKTVPTINELPSNSQTATNETKALINEDLNKQFVIEACNHCCCHQLRHYVKTLDQTQTISSKSDGSIVETTENNVPNNYSHTISTRYQQECCSSFPPGRHKLPTFADDLNIETTKGKVVGVTLKSATGKEVDAWYGIPYAEKPVADLRFKPAIPKKPWKHIKATDRLPYACIQIKDTFFGDFPGAAMWVANTRLSEDCLYVNVVVPKPRPTNATVMVWIYGGGFYSGSSVLDIYDPKTLVSEENVIVVSMQYRVASLGFLYLDHPEAPGNVGFLDQILALKWVQENIAAFGGNPEDVTIFGESAGSISVSLHLLNPLSRNLFKRAIMQSGTAAALPLLRNKQDAIEIGLQLAKQMGCPHDIHNLDKTIDCLKRSNSTEIVYAEQQLPPHGLLNFPFLPVKDGITVGDISHQLTHGDFKKTDILLGANGNEGNYFLIYTIPDVFKNEENITVTYENLVDVVRKSNPDRSEIEIQAILYEYTNWINLNDSDANCDASDKIIGDPIFTCPTKEFADIYAKDGNKVYVYSYKHTSDRHYWPKWSGTLHADEIAFVFGEPMKPERGYSSNEIHLSKRLMKYWSNFAKTGNPNKPSDVFECHWPSYKLNKRAYINLDLKNCNVGFGGLRPKQCALWNNLLPKLREVKSNLLD
ncbi:hypothetical protein FQR65_LT02849 [Abscondita terminalis]|nr:hypothetical protein FQR65_LT02849 [Abscondita terminalis]